MSHRFYITPQGLDNKNKTAILSGAEFDHASKVLRLKQGEAIELFDGKGIVYEAEIIGGELKTFVLEIKKTHKKHRDYSLGVFVGAPKGRKADAIVNMLTQAGATVIGFYQSRYTEAKIGKEKADRLEKIAIEACKQSKRSWLPTIETAMDFDGLSKLVKKADKTVIFYENADEYLPLEEFNADHLTIVIGPEGGFSSEEIGALKKEKAITSLLSDGILRVETAALAATQVARYAQLPGYRN